MKNFKVRYSGNSYEHFNNGNTYFVKDGFLVSKRGHEFGLGEFDSESMGALNKYMSAIGCVPDAFELVKEDSQVFTKDDIRSGDKVWTSNGRGIVVAFEDGLIVTYTDHSGWDNAKSVTINKVIRPTIPYHLTRDAECEGTVVFDRAEGIGCEPVHKFSVGDSVNIADMGCVYSLYESFIKAKAPAFERNFIKGGEPSQENSFVIVAMADHLDHSGKLLCIIKDTRTQQVFIFDEKGLEKA